MAALTGEVAPRTVNPRVARLLDDQRVGRVDLSTFWDDLATLTTPLVDELPDHPGHVLVTFVWRATRPTVRAVSLPGAPVWHQSDAAHEAAAGFAGLQALHHVPGTDVWWRSYVARSDVRTLYSFREYDHDLLSSDTTARDQPDPLNPRHWPATPPVTAPLPMWAEDPWPYLELPSAPRDAALIETGGVAPGKFELHSLPTGADTARRVWLYTPPDAEAFGQLPVLVLHDGWHWTWPECSIATIIDNLIASGELPPMAVVAQESPESGREELACDPQFADYVADELLPWARERLDITTDPSRTIVAGQSYGGLAASFLALRRPDTFGNVISQSGSYWFPAGSEFDEGAGGLIREYAAADRLPVRFYLDVGLLEQWMVPYNRHFRDVLVAKGYPVSYREYNGGHSHLCWRHSMPGALRDLTTQWDT